MLSPEQEFKAAWTRAEQAPNQFQQAEKDGQVGREFSEASRTRSLLSVRPFLSSTPPDGMFPALTPEGKRIGDQMKSTAVAGEHLVFNSYEDFDVKDRCITHGMFTTMFPFHYNNGIQIFQAPGEVVIFFEMIHDVRIIPLSDNTPPGAAVQEWLGTSMGTGKGNTLVVETTNVFRLP